MIGDSGGYASGNWFVREGAEERFVSRWNEFLEWTRDLDDGFDQAILIQDASDHRHFVSVGHWNDRESQEAWRSQPDWPDRFNACRELCDRFEGGGSFSLTASIVG